MSNRNRLDIQRQKQGKLIKHCPNCKSSQLVQVDSKEMCDGEIIYFKGQKCIKCGFINARRFI